MDIPWDKLCDHVEVIKPPTAEHLLEILGRHWQFTYNKGITREAEILSRLAKCKSIRPLKGALREMLLFGDGGNEQVFINALDKWIGIQPKK